MERPEATTPPSSRSHLLAAATACVIWGGSVVGTKLSFGFLSPMALGLVRFGLSAACFFILLALRGQLSLPRGRELRLMATTGLLGTTAYFAAENVGCSLVSASTAALVLGAIPAMTMVLECGVDRTRPSVRMLTGIALAFAGVGVLSLFESGGAGGNQLLGILVLMAGGACWAVYNILMRGFSSGTSTLVITSWQTLFGALGFVPLALVEAAPVRAPDPASALSLAYLVLACTVGGFTLYNYGLKGLSASVAASLVNLTPVVGLAASALILGESITPAQLVACAAIVAGILLSTR